MGGLPQNVGATTNDVAADGGALGDGAFASDIGTKVLDDDDAILLRATHCR